MLRLPVSTRSSIRAASTSAVCRFLTGLSSSGATPRSRAGRRGSNDGAEQRTTRTSGLLSPLSQKATASIRLPGCSGGSGHSVFELSLRTLGAVDPAFGRFITGQVSAPPCSLVSANDQLILERRVRSQESASATRLGLKSPSIRVDGYSKGVTQEPSSPTKIVQKG